MSRAFETLPSQNVVIAVWRENGPVSTMPHSEGFGLENLMAGCVPPLDEIEPIGWSSRKYLSKCWLKSLTYISSVANHTLVKTQTEVFLLTTSFQKGGININPVLHGHTQDLEPQYLYRKAFAEEAKGTNYHGVTSNTYSSTKSIRKGPDLLHKCMRWAISYVYPYKSICCGPNEMTLFR